MGLDQYAYAAAKANAKDDYYHERYDLGNKNTVDPTIELAYWRKHPNLQGWMEQLWNKKGRPGLDANCEDDIYFNGIELELTWEDLDRLEADIKANRLPHTTGFFFGNPSDDYYREKDLEFVRKARVEIFTGLKVFYNSSW